MRDPTTNPKAATIIYVEVEALSNKEQLYIATQVEEVATTMQTTCITTMSGCL
jgi:YbbR domain-containing protein